MFFRITCRLRSKCFAVLRLLLALATARARCRNYLPVSGWGAPAQRQVSPLFAYYYFLP